MSLERHDSINHQACIKGSSYRAFKLLGHSVVNHGPLIINHQLINHLSYHLKVEIEGGVGGREGSRIQDRDPKFLAKLLRTGLPKNAPASGTEAFGTEAPGTEAFGTEAAGTETPGTEAAATEASGTEAFGTETEGPGTGRPGTEGPGTEAFGTEASEGSKANLYCPNSMEPSTYPI